MHALNTARATLHHGRAPVQTIALRVRNNRETDVPLEWVQRKGWRTRVHDGLHGASCVSWVRWGCGASPSLALRKNCSILQVLMTDDDDVDDNVAVAPPCGGRQQRLSHGTVHKNRCELDNNNTLYCRCGRSRGGRLARVHGHCGVGATPKWRPHCAAIFWVGFCGRRERESKRLIAACVGVLCVDPRVDLPLCALCIDGVNVVKRVSRRLGGRIAVKNVGH
jgi:hypothetical protein